MQSSLELKNLTAFSINEVNSLFRAFSLKRQNSENSQ